MAHYSMCRFHSHSTVIQKLLKSVCKYWAIRSYRSLVCLLRSSYLSRSRAPLRSLVRSLAHSLTHSLPSSWDSGIFMCGFSSDLNHCAGQNRFRGGRESEPHRQRLRLRDGLSRRIRHLHRQSMSSHKLRSAQSCS